MVNDFMQMLVEGIGTLGYPGIFLLMAMESSLIPVPSELVMPPAGYLAQQGLMNPWIAILVGTVGSLAGAYVNYYGARYLGRPLILKYGKYFLIPEQKFHRIERFFFATWRNIHIYRKAFTGSSTFNLNPSRAFRNEPSAFLNVYPVGCFHLVFCVNLDRLFYRSQSRFDNDVFKAIGNLGFRRELPVGGGLHLVSPA